MKYFVFWKVERYLTYIGRYVRTRDYILGKIMSVARFTTIVGMGGGGYA